MYGCTEAFWRRPLNYVFLWIKKGVWKEILIFLVFNILLLTSDVAFDILTCKEFFENGNTAWAYINLFMIFNPFLLRSVFLFIAEMKNGESKSLIKTIKEVFLTSSACLPLVQTIRNIQRWHQLIRQLILQKIYSTEASKIFRFQGTSIVNSMFETFAEGAPCQILNLYIFMLIGYMSRTQIISICLSIVSLSITGVKLFFFYRAEYEIEVDPGWRLILLTIFPMMINTIASIISWTFIASHTGGYIVLAILFVFFVNWISIQCVKCNTQNTQNTENAQNTQDTERPEQLLDELFLVWTAMISTLLPCVVGAKKGVFMAQILATNLSKLGVLSCIWFLQWYTPEENKYNHWFLNTPLVTCVTEGVFTTEPFCSDLENTTFQNGPCYCSSLQSCFCGFSCPESPDVQINLKKR